MHDFCFTIPYGILILFGGSMGYFRKGSVMSLVGGLVSGLLLLLAGQLSLSAFHKGANSWGAQILQTVVAVTLTLMMGARYSLTGKVMPGGFVAGISGIMALFYIYKLATGGNHIPKKINMS